MSGSSGTVGLGSASAPYRRGAGRDRVLAERPLRSRRPTREGASHEGCADWSAELDEPLGGSGTCAQAWLLIEVPGPWGPAGATESGLDRDLAEQLEADAAQADVRIQLVRRRDQPVGSVRRLYLASSRPAGPWLAHRTTGRDHDALRELDLARLTGPDPAPAKAAGWELTDEPLFLVCTHARRDPCCAVYGRAAAAVLSVTQRERFWETSHTGGHRFAPSLLCLPDGLAFGRLDPEATAQAAAAYAQGDVEPHGFRGRSADAPAVQAAEVAVRTALGRLPVGAVRPTRVQTDGPRSAVDLTTPLGPAEVVVVQRPTGRARLIGCAKTEPTDPGEHAVVSLNVPTTRP